RIWAGGALATDSWGTLLTVRGRVLTAATLLWALGALRFFLRIPDLFMVTAAGTLALVVLLLVDSQAVVRRLELGSREEQVVYRPPGPPDAGG
ncbi:MAG TPA: hypothetical protein VEI97_10090, partial [bacterium]|nr:hypothetical protein [bacterium]